MFSICPERPCDAAAIETLLDEVFGPGRHARMAYRLREDTQPVKGLSFVAIESTSLRGSIRFSWVSLGGKPVLFLGPLVVREEDRGRGVGLALLQRGLKEAKRIGARNVLLVGDAPYYARVGFKQVGPGRIVPPMPVDQDRLLGLEFEPGAFKELRGSLMSLRDASLIQQAQGSEAAQTRAAEATSTACL